MDRDIFFEQIKNKKYFPKNYKEKVLKKFPKFKIIHKRDSKNIIILASRFLLKLIKIISFGKIDFKYDMRTSTQGYTIYISDNWYTKSDLSKYSLIEHELVHMGQWKKWNILYKLSYVLNIWSILLPLFVGFLGANFLQILLTIFGSLFLPAIYSFRGIWELQAFRKTIQIKNKFQNYQKANTYRYYFDLLTGPQYYFALLGAQDFVAHELIKYLNESDNSII